MGRTYCMNCGCVGCDDDFCKPEKHSDCECGGVVEVIYNGQDKVLECNECFKVIIDD